MTMEEVNEKFPTMKYGTLVLERAREGRPTPGVVSVPASRANSVQETNDKVLDKPARYRQREGKEDIEETDTETRQPTSPSPTSQTQETPRHVHQGSSGGGNGDGDEHIYSLPNSECPSILINPCAVCISSLESDDDIRALTCGHAFHAPTPEGDPNAAGDLGPRDSDRLSLPRGLRAAWFQGSDSNLSRQGTSVIRVGGESRSWQATLEQPQDQVQRDAAITPAPRVQTRLRTSVQLSNDGMSPTVRPPQCAGQPNNHKPITQNTESRMKEMITPSQLEAGSSEH
ncbi:uncharacterized protein F5Z01DRAFT_696598 [Emericellopsis atlantica]|uniref:RING-type domain-containing protein n=1 Tax=Emericellopsis atlantica TaxID=2614577 RepID=A0A9P8CSF0_9HYPO|nr:uncharacterized protein F5Z01DRAFT_696598 [Emericellopsis atlantica]KAG9257145.1 hypothetical protein F5Z01DRAFT_696598 [Emericellopsis atlantica]